MTTPTVLNQVQAAGGYPPSHPFPHWSPQHVSKSCAEILVWRVWFDTIQILSVRTSTAAKAQHDPQVDWSLIYLIDSHFGQCSAEKNSVGMFSKGWISLVGIFKDSGVDFIVPMSLFTYEIVISSKYELCPETHNFSFKFVSFTITSWFRIWPRLQQPRLRIKSNKLFMTKYPRLKT